VIRVTFLLYPRPSTPNRTQWAIPVLPTVADTHTELLPTESKCMLIAYSLALQCSNFLLALRLQEVKTPSTILERSPVDLNAETVEFVFQEPLLLDQSNTADFQNAKKMSIDLMVDLDAEVVSRTESSELFLLKNKRLLNTS
jgi:hypothetical protein